MSEPFDENLKDRRAGRSADAAPLLLPELHGRRIAWAGVESAEPMLRGCDQHELLERLAAAGIRHLIVPLNGAAEDGCIFARRHVENASGGAALYDLERRDEGAFTRLKFLLETARSIGVMLGISLFDAASSAEGPLCRGANIQCFSFTQSADARAGDRLRSILNNAADWVCSAARGFEGLWIETFRNAAGEPGTHERALCARIAETLAKHHEDLSPMRLGPWVALRREGMLAEKYQPQAAPFDANVFIGSLGVRDDFAALLRRIESASSAPNAQNFFSPSTSRLPALLRFPEGAVDSARCDWLWRVFFRGYWPVVSMPLSRSRDSQLWETIASLARFAVAWAGRGALRPYPELLAPMPELTATAAEDGAGRYFAFFSSPVQAGLRLALPPGFYRYYWITPNAARIIDRGDGVEGGESANLPGSADADAKLLVIEQNELPDSLAVW